MFFFNPTEVNVSITGDNQAVREDVGQVEVCIELNHSPLVPVYVTLTTLSGTAMSKRLIAQSSLFKAPFLDEEDYGLVEKNVTFGVGLGTVECVHIPILNDVCLEDETETFSVSISSEVECVVVEPAASSVEITIVDDDGTIAVQYDIKLYST